MAAKAKINSFQMVGSMHVAKILVPTFKLL